MTENIDTEKTILHHPTFDGLWTYADSTVLPSFKGARCSEVGSNIWYYPDDDDPLGRKAWHVGKHGRDTTIQTTYDALAGVCAHCPALLSCFNYAVHHEQWGFWGGTSRPQRMRMRETLGITLRELHNSDEADKMILESRRLREENLNEEQGGTE